MPLKYDIKSVFKKILGEQLFVKLTWRNFKGQNEDGQEREVS